MSFTFLNYARFVYVSLWYLTKIEHTTEHLYTVGHYCALFTITVLAVTNCTYMNVVPSTRDPVSSFNSFVCLFLSEQSHQQVPLLFELQIHDLDHCSRIVNFTKLLSFALGRG